MVHFKLKSFYTKWMDLTEDKPWLFPVSLFLLTCVTYGIFIFSLGFYWDDWTPLMLTHIADKLGPWKLYASDRPFQSWTYFFLLPLCKNSTFAWQFSALFFRYTSALALYYTFLNIFPRQKQLLQWASVLFLVFPGFGDLYASVSFGSHFITYTVFGLSLLFMVLSVTQRNRFWLFYPLSLVFAAVHMFTMEYFVGLELVRPILVLILLVRSDKKIWKSIGKTLIHYLPYLLILTGFFYWRMVVYPTSIGGQHESNTPYLLINFTSAPLTTFIGFVKSSLMDIKFLLINAWTDRLWPDDLPIDRMIFWFSIFVGLVVSAFFYFFQLHTIKEQEPFTAKWDRWLNIGLGYLIILLGMFPVWSTLRQITSGKWSDRFDIAAIFGVVFMLTTILFVIVQNSKIRNFILILLVGLSISFQIRTANDYRNDFKRQKDFYTQLYWRVPALEPNTAIYSPGIPTTKAADYSYAMGLNLLYNTSQLDYTFDYWFIGPRDYPLQSLLDQPTHPINMNARIFTFQGSAGNIISVNYPPGGCLWVVNPLYAQANTANGNLPLYAQLSNDDRILSNPKSGQSLMSEIMDLSPQDTWCYFFEKADLAQSKGDWQTAVSLLETADSLHLHPSTAYENIPFIKSYAELGQINKAVELTENMVKKTQSTQSMVCTFWNDYLRSKSGITLESIQSVYNAQVCPEYFN